MLCVETHLINLTCEACVSMKLGWAILWLFVVSMDVRRQQWKLKANTFPHTNTTCLTNDEDLQNLLLQKIIRQDSGTVLEGPGWDPVSYVSLKKQLWHWRMTMLAGGGRWEAALSPELRQNHCSDCLFKTKEKETNKNLLQSLDTALPSETSWLQQEPSGLPEPCYHTGKETSHCRP